MLMYHKVFLNVLFALSLNRYILLYTVVRISEA